MPRFVLKKENRKASTSQFVWEGSRERSASCLSLEGSKLSLSLVLKPEFSWFISQASRGESFQSKDPLHFLEQHQPVAHLTHAGAPSMKLQEWMWSFSFWRLGWSVKSPIWKGYRGQHQPVAQPPVASRVPTGVTWGSPAWHEALLGMSIKGRSMVVNSTHSGPTCTRFIPGSASWCLRGPASVLSSSVKLGGSHVIKGIDAGNELRWCSAHGED